MIGGVIWLTVTYTYSALNQISGETDPADSSHTVSYAYDAEGRQLYRYDLHAGVTETTRATLYDPDGRPVTATASSTTGAPTFQSVKGYDPAGAVTSLTTSLGGATISSITNSFAPSGHVTSTAETLSPPTGSPVTKLTAYSYLNDGLVSSRVFDGVTTTFGYQLNGQESSNTPASGSPFTTSYFANGAFKAATLPNGSQVTQSYDAASRLAARSVKSAGGTILTAWSAMGYDPNSQVTSTALAQSQPAINGTTTYGYDALHRMTSFRGPLDGATTSYALDNAGNVTGDGTTTFNYAANRLTSSLAGGITTTYGYDHLGNQASETTGSSVTTTSYDAASHPYRVNGAGGLVSYEYDGLGRLTQRLDPNGSSQLFFHNGAADQVIQESDLAAGVVTGSIRYLLSSAGAPLGQVNAAGQASYNITSPRSDVASVQDVSGTVVASYGYDPFGNPKANQTWLASGAAGTKLQFQSAPKDPTTGQYNLGPRLYNPRIDRFVGADLYAASGASLATQLDPLTGNRYLYAGANPAGLIDNGYCWWVPDSGTDACPGSAVAKKVIHEVAKDAVNVKNQFYDNAPEHQGAFQVLFETAPAQAVKELGHVSGVDAVATGNSKTDKLLNRASSAGSSSAVGGSCLSLVGCVPCGIIGKVAGVVSVLSTTVKAFYDCVPQVKSPTDPCVPTVADAIISLLSLGVGFGKNAYIDKFIPGSSQELRNLLLSN